MRVCICFATKSLVVSAVVTLTSLCLLPSRRLSQFYGWVVPILAFCLSLYTNEHLMYTLVPAAAQSRVSLRSFLVAVVLTGLMNCTLFLIYVSGRRGSQVPGLRSWLVPLASFAFLGYSLMAPLLVFASPLHSFMLFLMEIAPIPLVVHEFELISGAVKSALSKVAHAVFLLRNQADNIGIRLAINEEHLVGNVIVTMRMFFLVRSCFYATYLLTDAYLAGMMESNPLTDLIWSNYTYTAMPANGTSASSTPQWKIALAYLAVRSCDTAVAVLGTSAVVSEFGQYVTDVFVHVLDAPHNDDSDSSGAVLGVLFIMLALQSSITMIDPQKRVLRLYRSVILQLTALLHFMGRILDDSFQRMSALGTRFTLATKARLLLCSSWLVLVILLLIRFLFSDVTGAWSNPWILSVTLFSGEVIVRLLLSFLTFLQNLKLNGPAQLQPDELELIEGRVFKLKVLGSVIELTIGVLLLVNGVFILATDYGGLIRLVLMSVHAYGNVWLQAQDVYGTYKRRREADSRIALLGDASAEELAVLDDKCSICQEDMRVSAKRTGCGHHFHAGCLKRWLYVQEVCPNCHTPVQRPAS